ncbi:3-isopropylmalate dehydratase large subunit [Testudinibacter sp. TR-2022]|uniref:3-isopropylmalate dehydratase large subunit n=1 Tax=Testudinibacter sp. TR-2022 TaxID=2585029 RepID=UPI00111B47FD|nr:3-isopropylmalate dehydratase large subunit [Testudinibacter sp. TR-2022]TNH07246.1 3-isopropylmalate dehydratase large subunit [Pasteurellaceae bacterium Phil11]TNH21116.1 3-isopropylmalate dehydratase large subunit [Testudinibacter sp. TR-2022]TNH27789.1 3-isopropylmalate dehydratase large subunit [Testudinibacter sp. TR-2022]
MGKTLSEKILAKNAHRDAVNAGDVVWVDVDRSMMDDILGPRVQIAEKLPELTKEIKNRENVIVISDHYTPPANIRQAEIVKFTRDWSSENNIDNYYEFEGPCHQVMAEYGHVLPGTVILGTDSHTCMGGALGAFASGVGSTEMLGILATGQTWLKVPETIQVRWDGQLNPGVMAKDISLKTIGVIGHAGATYKAVEYVGETFDQMEIEQRMAITNMAVEMGAKVGLMPVDDKTIAYLDSLGIQRDSYSVYHSDADARFCQKLHFNSAELLPQVACPHEVDNVTAVMNVNTPIHQAYLGSCTGGRLSDLVAAAELLKGKKIAKGIRLLVSPSSKKIWKAASDAGVLSVLAEAGAVILAPTCGVCVGLHSGLLAPKEVCISASNRNFIGRMGSKEAFIYLGSPLTVAASAITGRVTDPREFL